MNLVFYLITFVGVAIFYCNKKINNASRGKLYADIHSIPFKNVGLLLGTSKYVSVNQLNPYYTNRIEAAKNLIKAGKIKYLIISGDNRRKDYGEPTSMRLDLISAGVDSSVIFLDNAGFRTFDSIVRSKEVFGQSSLTIISQPFHNKRAIFIASKENIAAIGFNARDVGSNLDFKVQVRERFARVKVFLDYLFGNRPKFLGQKIVIPSESKL